MQAILAESAPTLWLPGGASTVSGQVDNLFNIILWICIFFFLLVSILLVLFTIMYRHKPGQIRDTAAGHSTTLELTWTLIPSVIVVFLYYYGFRHYMEMTIEPPNSYEITAVGKMWQWTFRYPTGLESNELHIPVNTPIRTVLSSSDVIHSLYIPAFRMKKDVVPGRFNRMWFQATDVGTYDIYCAAYCGTNHSIMRSVVVVQPKAEFDKWLKEQTELSNNLPPVQKGEKLYRTQGCSQCHSIDGSKLVGPSWQDAWGRTETIQGGGQVLVDKPYVVESILQPQAKIVEGYPASMPPFVLKEADIDAIIAYLKSISSHTSEAEKATLNTPAATQPAGGAASQPASTPVEKK
jgi:cytochrome c oxidase subunit 2